MLVHTRGWSRIISNFLLSAHQRLSSLLAAKSTSFPLIESSTTTILSILQEIGNHKAFCAKFGITEDELENTPESAATTAYGAYVLDTGLQGNPKLFVCALVNHLYTKATLRN